MSTLPGPWPAGIEPYRRTSDFTETTVPAGLLRSHNTRAGVWAKLHVTEGMLRFHDAESGEVRLLLPGAHPLIFPERRHHVEIAGPVRFFVEFYAERRSAG